jgi:biotin carboxylase
MARKRVLVVFPKEWDRQEFGRGDYSGYEFVYAGFDLFRFPSNARLLWFDAPRFVDALVERWRGRIDGVFSNNEYFGALIAAAVAERLGLPGTPPATVITAQHKYYSRLAQRTIAPDAVPRFAVFPHDVRAAEQVGLEFPLYVKPVRATFSVLARRVEDFRELQRHLCFSPFEELVIRRLVKPFNDLMPRYCDYAIDAHHLIAEEPLTGMEFNVDGYVRDGDATVLGICDTVMFPGTDQFQRFVYPSRLPGGVQRRARELAARLLAGLGYRHGFFNVEMFWDPAADSLKLIEVNPRLASQLAGLYRHVEGCNPHRMLLELCTGGTPLARRVPTGCTVAASFVSRRFDGRPLAREPGAAELARVAARHPDASVMLYLKRGAALAREMKWLGSYRYAVVNLGAADEEELERRYAEIRALLHFDDEAAPWRVPGFSGVLR